MKILKKILIALVALVALLLIVGLLLPSTSHIERSTVISAPQSTVFALVNGYTRFNDWSPWAEMDPEARYTREGPAQGVGAKQTWQSDDNKVGSGSQEITMSEPYRRVETALDFGPQGTAQAFFDLAPEGDAIRVVWGFDTSFGYNLIGRYFGLFFDSMLGPNYDKGPSEPQTAGGELATGRLVGSRAGDDRGRAGPHRFRQRHQLPGAGRHRPGFRERPTAKSPPSWANTAWLPPASRSRSPPPGAKTTTPSMPEFPWLRPRRRRAPKHSPVQIGQTYGGKVLKVVHKGAYSNLRHHLREDRSLPGRPRPGRPPIVPGTNGSATRERPPKRS